MTVSASFPRTADHILITFNICGLQSGYVAHELGHALGLFHEHQRPDRDDFISVVRENIKTGQESNFSPVNPTFIDYLGVPYDLTSDMHYRAGVSSTQIFLEFKFTSAQKYKGLFTPSKSDNT